MALQLTYANFYMVQFNWIISLFVNMSEMQ